MNVSSWVSVAGLNNGFASRSLFSVHVLLIHRVSNGSAMFINMPMSSEVEDVFRTCAPCFLISYVWNFFSTNLLAAALLLESCWFEGRMSILFLLFCVRTSAKSLSLPAVSFHVSFLHGLLLLLLPKYEMECLVEIFQVCTFSSLVEATNYLTSIRVNYTNSTRDMHAIQLDTVYVLGLPLWLSW